MLYRAKTDRDLGVRGCKIIGNDIPLGYELVETFFVDSSGFGSKGELALTFEDFLDKVRAGFYYGIKEAGQFQVYIGEYKKLTSLELKEQKDQQGIISRKIVKRNLLTILTTYKNGDKVLTLVNTDIIKWIGDKIILNSGGWDTATTRARFNEFLPAQVKVFRKNGETFVNYCGGIAKFKDEMDIRNTIYTKE